MRRGKLWNLYKMELRFTVFRMKHIAQRTKKREARLTLTNAQLGAVHVTRIVIITERMGGNRE